jgi:hypothetical protein
MASTSARFFHLPLVLSLVLALVACSTVKLGQAAADDAFRAVGKAGGDVVLAPDDLERFSARYGVSSDAMKRVAPEAASVPSWSNVKSRIASIYRAVNDDEAASAATGIGCEGLTGQIKTEAELQESLTGALGGMSPDRILTTRRATQELQEELAKIKRDGTEKEKAAALWLCYAFGLAV